MTQLEAKNFIEDNRAVLIEFQKKINEIDTIEFRHKNIELEVLARRHAREIVYKWITEILGVAKGEMKNFIDEENDEIFKEYETDDKVESQF